MPAKLHKREVGPWPMNVYVITCEGTRASTIVDPGDEAEEILAIVSGNPVEAILLTHGHFDHIQALEEVKRATDAPVYLHPLEAEKFDLSYDVPLSDGLVIPLGNLRLRAVHTPGHTPGMTCFDLGDNRVLVGDTIFVGGPGKTWSPEDFNRTMRTMQEIVFAWPDDTVFHPGHGPSGVIGKERPDFEAFLKRGWPEDLHGDVTWK